MPDLQALIKKRGIIKATLTNIKKFTDKFSWDSAQAVNVEQIETRIEKLNEAWKEFHELEYQILLFDDQVSESEEFEDRYYEIKAILKRLLNTRTPSIAFGANISQENKSMLDTPFDRSNNQASELRLPRVMIEYFSGDYSKWQSFQDQFETSIHSKDNLSSIHKFQYLKSLLKNEAASLIRHMSLTDANYLLAWEKLKKRYSKKKYSVRDLIEQFLNQPSVSNDGYKQLRSICDTSDEVLRGLQALGSDWQSRDPWLIHILTRKLDIETQQSWAKHSSDNDVPTIDCLLDFLTERCDALEACSNIRRPTSTRHNPNVRVHTATTNLVNCVLCNANSHPLFKCFKFKRLNFTGRNQFIKTNNLCGNCLSSSHDINSCQSLNRCFKCGNKHHTLLHPSDTQSDQQQCKTRISPNQNQTSSNYFSTQVESTINEQANQSSINKHISPTTINKTASTKCNLPLTNSESKPKSINSQSSLNYHCATNDLSSKNTVSTLHSSAATALLSTVVFYIQDDFGIKHKARGLLDSGSQTTLISDRCVRRVGLHRHRSFITINGLASQKAATTKGEVQLHLVSRLKPEKFVAVRAVILSHLTSKLPITRLDDSNWPIVKTLDLADPSYTIPGTIDIILGNDIFYEVLKPEQIRIADHFYAQSTSFGWVLGGQLISSTPNSTTLHTTAASNDTDQLIQRFWDIEEFNSSQLKPVENECENHYIQNTTRRKDGRYIVRLPFKKIPDELGSTYHQAKKRFVALERKFISHPQIKRDYIDFMKEYEKLGHMEIIDYRENTSNQLHQGYHLPHHCVLKETSSTTKLRVVFDGSCKSTNGQSLNDMLLVGPTIQDDLMTILLRFRTHKIALAADIEKMYRQIVIHPADRDYQRIIWCNLPNQDLQEFRLTTVTYGTSSAPFLACRTLHQLANDYRETFPDAAYRLKSDFYVDDMLTGCEDLTTASKIFQDMNSLLEKGGFKLRKWMSNDKILMSQLQKSGQGSNLLEFEDTSSIIKTLGLLWNPQTDNFTFKVTLKDTETLSKRTLLSESSRIFDPLGWLSPSTILIKTLFQQIWLRKLNWDDELPGDIKEKWRHIRSSLQYLQDIQIPRFMLTHKNDNTIIQLHGFSDASETAYGAAVYLRIQDVSKNVVVNLLAAKTKVAPIKQLSIPRLELCAAVLLCRLLQYVQGAAKLTITSTHAWTDSQIVLTWLSDIPRKWNCFIGNRTSYILENIPRDKWMYIPSKQNPADLASRGLTPQALTTNKLWWNGPEWLVKDVQHWPKHILTHDQTKNVADKNLEIRKKFIDSYHVTVNPSHICQELFTKFSSLNKIYRILSYIYRVVLKARRKHKDEVVTSKGCILPPTVDELILAENCCIKWVQAEAFHEELQYVTRHNEAKKGSILSSLTPFIDDQGIMRVGGRLSNSCCSFDVKHPIILPHNHLYTRLLVDKYHRENVHPGPTLLTSIIRQRFWIIGCRKVTRWYVQKCILCFMRRKTLNRQLMADLPRERVSTGRPFLNTGVDYAGPLYVRDRKGRGKYNVTKAYIALFICLSVKAVHIELVSDMTTEAFIAALKRFISRRGFPCQIHCDNGSNFVGARNELHALYELFKTDNHTKLIYEFLFPQKIRFKFNPPNAPHFGGLWESNIKSVKSHFYRVSKSTTFTYEEANTLLIQIEAVLNSRPLCAITNDVTSYDVLTPAHFLIGEPLTSIPEPDLSHIKSNRLSKYQNIQNRVQAFWRLWSRDYLSALNQRTKWKTKTKNLIINQLVVIQEDNVPQSHWIIGRIEQIHCGKDGHVRVATVKTARGVMKRPIVKLIPLPIEDDNNTDVPDKSP